MKGKYVSRRYWKDRSTPMGKVDELSQYFDDVIDLSLGDTDIPTNDIIIDGAFVDTKAGHTKYTDFRGDPELRYEIIQFYKEEYDVCVDDSEIFVTQGGCIAMYLSLEAILDDGDEVIMQAPYFTPYPQQIELVRGIPVELATYEEDDYQIDFKRLRALTNERTKAIIINTPSNPTGAVITAENLSRLAEYVIENDLILISDDIYTAFSYDLEFEPIIKFPGMRERSITINSFSKNYSMTGWRVGNIIAPPQIVKVIQQINENVMFTTTSISQRAAIYALRSRKLIQPAIIEEYRERMFYAAKRINRIHNMSVTYPPTGSFYLFVNIKGTGLSSSQVSEIIFHEAHILSIPGSAFGACGEGYIRLVCSHKIEKLEEAFNKIEKVSIFRT